MFCKHNWVKINEHHFPSQLEKMMERGVEKIRNLDESAMQGTLVTDYKCEKCDKIKRFKSKT